MQWHINDLSLQGQFSNSHAFQEALEPLMILRSNNSTVRNQLHCGRDLYKRHVTSQLTFQQAVSELADREFKSSVLNWITKQGPLWDYDSDDCENNYFEYDGNDVTVQGLGEATRRQIRKILVSVFSFIGGTINFENTPLQIQQGLAEEIHGIHDVTNIWEVAKLKESALSVRADPKSWGEFLAFLREKFSDTLLIGENIEGTLAPYPFNGNVVRQGINLLSVLSDLVKQRDDAGRWTKAGQEIYNKHFKGDKAWFTSESIMNKITFKRDMTFADPADQKLSMFCPWHGKIKTPQYRVHFQWPIPKGQKVVKIVYIGPKITKR